MAGGPSRHPGEHQLTAEAETPPPVELPQLSPLKRRVFGFFGLVALLIAYEAALLMIFDRPEPPGSWLPGRWLAHGFANLLVGLLSPLGSPYLAVCAALFFGPVILLGALLLGGCALFDELRVRRAFGLLQTLRRWLVLAKRTLGLVFVLLGMWLLGRSFAALFGVGEGNFWLTGVILIWVGLPCLFTKGFLPRLSAKRFATDPTASLAAWQNPPDDKPSS